MQRYFFHIIAEGLEAPDLIGADLDGHTAVRQYAEAQRADIWAQRVLAGKPPLTGWLEVVDHEEREVMRLPL